MSIDRLKGLIVLSIYLFLCVSVMAQTEELAFKTPPLFTKLGYDQGYPEPIVLKIFQDDFGFIWIGTVDGGFRYDGSEYRTKVSN